MGSEPDLLRGIREGRLAADAMSDWICREIRSPEEADIAKAAVEMDALLGLPMALRGKIEKIGAYLGATARLGDIWRKRISREASEEDARAELWKCALALGTGSMGIDIGIEAIFFAKEGAEGEEARAAAKALGLSGNLEAQRLEWPTEMKLRELGGLREGLALDGPVGKKQEIARIFSAFGLTNEERSSMVEMIGLGKSTPLIAAMFSWTGMSREYLEEAERQAREIPDRDLAEFGRLGERIRDEILTVRPIGRALLVSRACGFLGGSSTGKFSLEPTSGPGAALARQLARSGVEPPEARWDRFLKMEDSREAGIALTELLMRSERGDVPDWDKNASLGALKLLGHPGILETFGELAAAKARAEGSVLGEAAGAEGAEGSTPKSKKRGM